MEPAAAVITLLCSGTFMFFGSISYVENVLLGVGCLLFALEVTGATAISSIGSRRKPPGGNSGVKIGLVTRRFPLTAWAG